MIITLFMIALAFMFLGLQLQSQVYAQGLNESQSQNQTVVLCNELAILNSLHQDTETLPSTAAGQSLSEQECGFKPNIATSQEGNKSNDS